MTSRTIADMIGDQGTDPLDFILNSSQITPEQRSELLKKSGAQYIAAEAMANMHLADAKKQMNAANEARTEALKNLEQVTAEANHNFEQVMALANHNRDQMVARAGTTLAEASAMHLEARNALEAARLALDEAQRVCAEKNL